MEGAAAYGFLSTVGGVAVEAVVRGRVHRLHLFVKREDPGAREVAVGLESFEREAVFYNTLLPHLATAWWGDKGQVGSLPSKWDAFEFVLFTPLCSYLSKRW